jgi:hypothetical protein
LQARSSKAAAGGWHRSRIVLWTQSGVWYHYLNIQDQYAPDLERFLDAASPICDAKTASGPETTSCFVLPASCEGVCSSDYTFIDEALPKAIARTAEREAKFSLYDITLQIGQRREEFSEHHVTSFLSLWQFWGLLNTLPEAAQVFDLPGRGGLACPVDTVIFEPRCKLFDGGRKTLRATWCEGCGCGTKPEDEPDYWCAARRSCG